MKKIPRLIFVAFCILQSNFLFSQQAKIPKLPPMPKMPSNLPAMPKMPQMPCNFAQDPRTLSFDQQFGRFGKVKSWTGDVSIERTYKKEFDGYSSEEIHASAHGGFTITNYDTDAVKAGMSNIWPWYTSIQHSQRGGSLLNQDWIASASYNSTIKEGDEVTNCSGGGSVKGTVNLQIQYGGTCYTLFVLTEVFKIKCKSKNSEEEREETIGGSNSFTAIPAKGDTLTGDTTLVDGTDKTRIRWKLYPYFEQPKVQVINLDTSQQHYVCSKNNNDTEVKFTAEVSPLQKDGEFEKFEVRMGSKPSKIIQNTGGKNPLLVLKGNGKKNDKVTIVAVYKRKGELIFSQPFELNWFYIDSIKFTNNGYELGEDCFSFSPGSTSDLELKAYTHAWKNGEEKKENIQWEINSVGAIKFKQETLDGGQKCKFTVNNLPEKNSDFGVRKIKVKYNDGDCDCEGEEKEIKIFFPRDSKNNPEGKYPNWFYYWKQIPKVKNALQKFPEKIIEVKNLFPPPIIMKVMGFTTSGTAQVGEVARYEYYEDIMYINTFLPANPGVPTEVNGKVRRGIDAFGTGLLHEGNHREDMIKWWGYKMANWDGGKDLDADLVPDAVEAKIGCRYNIDPWDMSDPVKLDSVQRSCPGRPPHLREGNNKELMDTEVNAYWEGWKWNVGDADKEDWASPGKQAPGIWKW